MKSILTVLALALSLSAIAQERVELNAKEISVNTEEAIVVRTNKTPETVKITFKVPMAESVCVRYETRHVFRQSAAYCGEDIHYRQVRVRHCVERAPDSGRCVRFQEGWRTERIAIARSCMVPETYCAEYGTAVSRENDGMKIRFKNLPALGDSESETFHVKARQKNYDGVNVVYEVTPLQTLREYKVTQKEVLGLNLDSFVIEEK